MTHLQEQLSQLRQSVTGMAALVAGQLRKSISALIDHDIDLANEVIFNEKRVNATELKIDKDCENIFALLTPVAHDMRFVFASLKINTDLERIGDYADGIAKLVIEAKNSFDSVLVEAVDVSSMYEITDDMLQHVGKAYELDDTMMAKTVFSQDLMLNDINHNATFVVADYCRKNPDKIEQALYLLSIVRKLERAGDHITNIAEEVIFFKEARILKHDKEGKLKEL